ncbi:MAG: hypothetical protein KIT14_18010 [bacterium]|nr:hypothetical protein [bacterium]
MQRRAGEVLAALAAGDADLVARLEAALADASLRRRWGAAWTLGRLGPPPSACLPVLVEAMAEADGDLRWAAATLVVAMHGTPGLEERLHALVSDGNASQRKMALYCLRDLAAPSARLDGLAAAALGDVEPGVRLAAMALGARCAAHRRAMAAHLAARLADADAGVRRAAAAVLGRFGERTPAVETALAQAAAGDDAALARVAAAALTALRT